MTLALMGYPRGARGWGIRNHVLVFPTHAAAGPAVEQATQGTSAQFVRHDWRGEWVGIDGARVARSFTGFIGNPNVVSVIVVGVTQEDNWIGEEASQAGQRVDFVALADHRGTAGTVEVIRRLLGDHQQAASKAEREPMNVSDLIVGLECGGSDALSGITANPAVGVASDMLVAAGATTLLGEIPELIGAENLLSSRADSPEVAQAIRDLIEDEEMSIRAMGFDPRGSEPSPGNMEGGLTTIEEKSLGAARKSGNAPIVDVLGFGQKPSKRGLQIMDTPGHDIEQMVGMVAAGAQIVLFTTGRGTPTGSPIVPCLKVTTNTHVFQKNAGDNDLDAGTILTNLESVEEVGKRIYNALMEVTAGGLTAAEKRSHREFAISRTFGQTHRRIER